MKQALGASLLTRCVIASFKRSMWTMMVSCLHTQNQLVSDTQISLISLVIQLKSRFFSVWAAGQITLDEFIEGAQRSAWLKNFLHLDVNPSGYVHKYLCDRKLMTAKDSWRTSICSEQPAKWKETWLWIYGGKKTLILPPAVFEESPLALKCFH